MYNPYQGKRVSTGCKCKKKVTYKTAIGHEGCYKNVLRSFLAILAVQAYAQGPATHDFQTWTNITANMPFNAQSKLRYWLETQERYGLNASRLSQVLIRPGIGYSLNEASSIWWGYGWFHTSTPFTENPHNENRMWQQYLWNKNYFNVTFSHRMRLEQRFIQNEPYVQWRFRDWWKMFIPLRDNSQFSVVIHNEVFLHFEHRVLTQDRLFVGLGNQINQHVRTEIGYIKQRIFRESPPNYSGNVVSFNLLLS